MDSKKRPIETGIGNLIDQKFIERVAREVARPVITEQLQRSIIGGISSVPFVIQGPIGQMFESSKVLSPLLQAIDGLQTYFDQQAELFQRAYARVKEVSTVVKEVNKQLLPHGWIFSLAVPVPVIFAVYKVLKEHGAPAAISAIRNYFADDVCAEMINKICNRPVFQGRVAIIRKAFEAHKRGEFELSIPVFLIQAEGAFIDRFQRYLYRSKKKGFLKSDIAANLALEYMVEGFEPWLQSVVAKSYGVQKPIPPGVFGRHPILHGRSVDYSTRENSIRAILLLDYVAFIASMRHR